MLTIGLAANLSGVGIETIRYYEREGVVPMAERAANGRRLYDQAAVARLRFVRRCRDLGFSVPQVKELLSLSSEDPRTCDEARAIGIEHLDGVRSKIADLAQMEAALVELMDNCAEGQTNCPLLARLFED